MVTCRLHRVVILTLHDRYHPCHDTLLELGGAGFHEYGLAPVLQG